MTSGRIPIDPSITTLFETNQTENSASGSLVTQYSQTNVFKIFNEITGKVINKVETNTDEMYTQV